MNWRKWIVVSFVAFALFIGGLVTVCVTQDISLVSKQYYQDELIYQDQLDRVKNTNALTVKPTIEVVDHGILQVSFDSFTQVEQGELILFSPAKAKQDRHINLKGTNGTVQQFDVRNIEKGMYRARMKWAMDGKEYYLEQVIFI